MQRDSLLLCFFLFVTRHVKSDGDCRNKKDVTVEEGEELKLISSIEPLKRCYFVFTDDSSDQCCFNRKGSNEDCETSNKYKPRNSTQCPEYVLTVDSLDTETCTLTIKRAHEAAAGYYKIFDQNHHPIRECSVEVIASGGWTGTITGIIIAVLLFVTGAGYVAWRRKRNTETTTTDVEVQNLLLTELPPNMKEALKKALMEDIIQKTESSDNGEVKVMLMDGSWKEVKTPADVEALSTIV